MRGFKDYDGYDGVGLGELMRKERGQAARVSGRGEKPYHETQSVA